MTMFRLGYQPDAPKGPGDKPDWLATDLLASRPPPPDKSLLLSACVVAVLHQLNIGSCVPTAGFQGIRVKQVWQLAEKMLEAPDVSGMPAAIEIAKAVAPELGARLWGYWLARSYHGMEDWDTGSQIRTFLRAVNKYGFMRESVYKYGYDVSKYAKAPPPLAYRQAADQAHPKYHELDPTAYYRIASEGAARIDDLKRALAAGDPVIYGTDVADDFASFDFDPGDTPVAVPVGKSIAGGHAMLLVGYDGDEFLNLSSWGTKWANGGYCWMSADYMAWPRTRDIWVITRVPANYSETS